MTRSNKSTSPPVSQRTESRGLKTCLHTHAQNVILYSLQTEISQGPLGRWLPGESMVYTSSETFVSLGKGGKGDIRCNRGEP